MKIRNKILVYFSCSIIVLSAISLYVIYVLFSEYREEGFQQRQKAKVNQTIKLLTEYKEMSENLSDMMDKLSIHDFYDERMMIYDSQKDLVYSSLDDLKIYKLKDVLNELSPSTTWIETNEGEYDIIGMYVDVPGGHYYAISKALDASGFSKLYFLRNTLLAIFSTIVLLVLAVSIYLSKKISKPITDLANHLSNLNFDEDNKEVVITTSTQEIKNLVEKFNALLKRTNESMLFQKHAIQHISHELKTPVAILVSELERISVNVKDADLKLELDEQVKKTKSLGDVINVLLQIAKIEAGQKVPLQTFRVDELLFDVIESLNIINTEFNFEIEYTNNDFDESRLLLYTNKQLMKQAIINLLNNSITYSSDNKAMIKIDCSSQDTLNIFISNAGITIDKEEEKYLFNHFFRGENSRGKTGFGLGLVLTQRIIAFANGSIQYQSKGDHLNIFVVSFPLR